MQYFLSRNYEPLYRFVPPGLRHPVLIILTILFCYGGSLDMFFNGAGLYTISASQYDSHTFLTQTFFWRPLATFGYRTLYALFGINPFYYRIFELTIHSLNALLVYYIARKLSKDSIVALTAGLMFAAFYSHTGTIFSGGLFYEPAYSFFCLVAILTFLHFQDSNKTGYLAVSLASIFLALLTKDSALVIFLLILTLDQIYRPHPLPRIRFGLILSLVVTGAVYFVLKTNFLPSTAYSVQIWQLAVKEYGIHYMLKQMYRAFFITISNVCPCKDLSGVFYLAFIVFIWKSTRYRHLAITTGTLLLVSLIPLLSIHGITNRYLYLPSAFSVIFLAVIIRYTVGALATRILPSYGELGVGLVTGAALLLIMSLNAYRIHIYETQYRDASNLFRTHLEDIVTTFPNGTKDYNLCLINTPLDLPRERGGFQVWEGGYVYQMLSLYYGKPDSVVEVKQLATDLGYALPRHQDKISSIISTEELDRIGQDTRNKVMVFNPYTEHMEDMTGKTSQEIRTAIENTKS